MLHVNALVRRHWTAAETAKNVGSQMVLRTKRRILGFAAMIRCVSEVQIERDSFQFSGSIEHCDWEIETESRISEMAAYLFS
jgi:hypothetical protein